MITCPICETENRETEEWCVECGWLLCQPALGEKEDESVPIEERLSFRVSLVLPERGSVPLRKARTIVGREFGDILIPEDFRMSRIHFALVAESGSLYVEDLRSSNGTLLNGVRIPAGRRYVLSDGDVITAGDSSLKVEFKGAPKEGDDSPGLYLVGEDGKKIRLRPGENTVGRLPLNTITIDNSLYVAREHAVLTLEKTPSGLFFLYLTDLGSSNGSFINHKAAPSHTRIRVNPGDELSFADVTFRVLEITPEED